MTDARAPGARSRRNRQLALLAIVELLAMGLWFSATAVVPDLRSAWGLSDGDAAWLTMSVQFGFVTGALLSAVLTLSDVWDPRRLIAGSSRVIRWSHPTYRLRAPPIRVPHARNGEP